jgi:glycosyltransferase involved in cell wall biosynthesis
VHASSDLPGVTVVVATFERVEACERAVRSALEQVPPPLEILVCDDGSSHSARTRLERFASEHAGVRYVWLPHAGSPGPARTLGLRSARAPWVAFLDDDDAWLPGKLRHQLERVSAGDVDVVGTNAIRSDGSTYFPNAPAEWKPTRSDVIRDNPFVVSSVLARRDLLERTPGFLPHRWARGVADYGMWLELADAGARMVVLGEPLVAYDSSGESRMSAARARQELAVAGIFWRRWLRRPADVARLRSAVNKSVGAAFVAGEQASAIAAGRRRA